MKPIRSGLRRSVSRRRPKLSLQPAHWIAWVVLAGCAIAALWLLTQSDIPWARPDQWLQQLDKLGWKGVVFFMAFVAIAIIIGPIPSTPFTAAAGTVWGPNQAALYGIIGIFVGSVAAYFIGRTLGRSAVKALTGKAVYLSSHRGERYLGWVIMIGHAIPVMPYDLLSYGAGISGLPFSVFALPCLLGIIPCTLMMTHLGAALTINPGMTVAIALVLIAACSILAWGVRRHNWFGLKEVILFH
ncbi:MAG: VTT domain-containing protein [Cyanobacteria bacterium P01_F01_bin.4]